MEQPQESQLKAYKGPWNKKGPLLLACRKCQRKLKREGNHPLSRMKKSVKKLSRKLDLGIMPFVIDTPCLSVCPREGVAVCTQGQAGRGECSILRQSSDLVPLLLQCAREAGSPQP